LHHRAYLSVAPAGARVKQHPNDGIRKLKKKKEKDFEKRNEEREGYLAACCQLRGNAAWQHHAVPRPGSTATGPWPQPLPHFAHAQLPVSSRGEEKEKEEEI
jgi:hypothetical protein